MIGKRYQEEKKAIGENQYTIPVNIQQTDETHLSDDKSSGNSYHPKKTEEKIAEQSKVNPIKPLKTLFSFCYLA